MANFPTSVWAPASKTAGQVIQPGHVNDMQDEVVAIEAGYINGTARLNSSNSTVANLNVSGASTLAGAVTMGAGVASTVSFASSVTFSTGVTLAGTLKPLGLSSGIANQPTLDVSAYTLALASGESTTFTGFTAGRLTIYEGLATGDVAWISVANSRTSIVHQTGTLYSTTLNSTLKVNIAVTAGTMTIQNQAGGAVQLRAELLKLA